MAARSCISVVIPAFNSAKYIRTAIDSALNQTIPPLEVLVINDGSTDNTDDVLREYRGSIRTFFQENSGPAVARNRAIAEAEGELIAFLDADDIWALEKLERQLVYAREHHEAMVIHTAFYSLYRDSGETRQTTPSEHQSLISGRCYSHLFLGNRIQISSVLTYKSCLLHMGGFDERSQRIRRASEDYDLWLRLARYYAFGYIDIPLMYYGQHSGNATNNKQFITEGELDVVKKALLSDAALKSLIGRRSLHDRLFNLLFDLGYWKHNALERSDARAYFRHALRYRPWDVYTWLLMIANSLPAPLSQKIRNVKRSLWHVGRTDSCQAQQSG